jgi:LPS export ABC transporter protein LptC
MRVVGRGIAAGSALWCAVLVGACSRSQPPGPARSGDQPLQITQNFTTTERDSGIVRYVLRARIAKFYADEVTRAEGVEVQFYQRGQKVSVLHSKEGFVDKDGRLRALGDVVVNSTEGATLTTQELYWDRAKNKIRADGAFKIVEKGEPLTGTGLTTDPDLAIIEVDSDVRGTTVYEKTEQP